MTKLSKIWHSKWKILEGIWYNHIVFFFNKTHWAYHEVKKRREACLSCPYFDKDGTGPNVVVDGQPSCGICGCVIVELTACLSCDCSDDATPRWRALKLKQEEVIEEKINIRDQIH